MTRRTATARSPGDGAPFQRRLTLVYPLATIGGFVIFMPLLNVILPLKISQIAPEDKVSILSAVLLVGALTASLGNLLVGALSDRSFRRRGTRRGWVVAGLPLLCCSYALIASASSGAGLIGAIIVFQLSLNVILAPLGAILADHVADDRKARVAALLNFGPPAGTVAAAVVALPVFGVISTRLGILLIVGTTLIAPLLLSRGYRFASTREPHIELPVSGEAAPSRDFLLVFLARFLVQTATLLVTTYLLFYLQDAAGQGARASPLHAQRAFALLTGLAAVGAIGWGYATGRWSDRLGRRKPFVLLSGATMIPALLLLAGGSPWPLPLIAYVTFHAGHASFVTIDLAASVECLPSARTRGGYLGLLNLANTLPSAIVPGIGLILLDGDTGDYRALFIASAVLIAAGIAAFLPIRRIR